MSKKTFSVADMLEKANHMLGSENFNEDEKRGIGIMVESVLHATGNYQGFSYNKTYVNEKGRYCCVLGTENSVCYHVAPKLREEYVALEQERKEKNGVR